MKTDLYTKAWFNKFKKALKEPNFKFKLSDKLIAGELPSNLSKSQRIVLIQFIQYVNSLNKGSTK